MISRLEGLLDRVDDGAAQLRVGDVWYEVLVPGCDQQSLAARVGEVVTLFTLQYFEGQGQGAHLSPRLIGFATDRDRAFFELFTTVKGVGNRKALRALQLRFDRVAEAIATKDAKLLQSLPEIGKRSAETIVAELHGKVDRFIEVNVGDPDRAADDPATTAARAMTDEAVAALVSLGEPKIQVVQLVDRALRVDPEIDTTEALITAVYRLKALPIS